jgi:hypothetical protein
VLAMVNACWLARRMETFETSFLSEHPLGTVISPKANRTWLTVIRAEGRYQRQLQRALQSLQTIRKVEIEPTPTPFATQNREIEPTARLTRWAASLVRLIPKPLLMVMHSALANIIRL